MLTGALRVLVNKSKIEINYEYDVEKVHFESLKVLNTSFTYTHVHSGDPQFLGLKRISYVHIIFL